MSAYLQYKELQGSGKESSTPQFLGMEQSFCLAIQDAEDNQGTGTSLMWEWSKTELKPLEHSNKQGVRFTYNQQDKIAGSTPEMYKMSPKSKYDSQVEVLGNKKENFLPQQNISIYLSWTISTLQQSK